MSNDGKRARLVTLAALVASSVVFIPMMPTNATTAHGDTVAERAATVRAELAARAKGISFGDATRDTPAIKLAQWLNSWQNWTNWPNWNNWGNWQNWNNWGNFGNWGNGG